MRTNTLLSLRVSLDSYYFTQVRYAGRYYRTQIAGQSG